MPPPQPTHPHTLSHTDPCRDVFNPSLISAFTKGKQMVPVLNEIGVHCAAVGNHGALFWGQLGAAALVAAGWCQAEAAGWCGGAGWPGGGGGWAVRVQLGWDGSQGSAGTDRLASCVLFSANHLGAGIAHSQPLHYSRPVLPNLAWLPLPQTLTLGRRC